MKWRTEIEKGKEGVKLNPERGILLAGSCFADYMGARMRAGLWDAQNPFGVLFNPLSIAEALRISLLSDEPENEYRKSIFRTEDKFLSWLADSKVWGCNRDETINKLTQRGAQARDLLKSDETLCVTFGTAYCYFLDGDNGRAVANCHKQPQSKFSRRRISADEICAIWARLIYDLKERYPDLLVIFTVSPVRHVRDGLHDNTLSKATLHLAIDQLCKEFDFCHYFPAYEILIDDLRDYRFYADDLVHPSSTAVEYIWEVFKNTYLDSQGEEMLKKGETISRRTSHRHIFPDSPEAIHFKQQTLDMYEQFRKEYPHALKIPTLSDKS
ncbi:MAG: GSCFA domain-containing protein [Muribaculaceae bacterium]|nr:GSCFA domain-containing protein [Muribaculaceae bacterium]